MPLRTAFWDAFIALPGWAHTLLVVAAVLLAALVAQIVLQRVVVRALARSNVVDRTVKRFFANLVAAAVWILAVVVALGVLGVNATALAGGLALGGFIVGFAVKDALGNVAAGVLLLLYRPFRLDDAVTIAGETGLVRTMGLVITTIVAADGRHVTIPNSRILGGTITNHTREPIRRADVQVGISYGDDIDTAVRAILAALGQDPRVLPDPPADIRIMALGESAVELLVRPWVQTADLWKAQADFRGIVKRAVEEAGCTVPFPQRDLHIRTYPRGPVGDSSSGAPTPHGGGGA